MPAAHIPTPEKQAQVFALASFLTPHTEIAKFIGIAPNTLTKHYEPELRSALLKTFIRVSGALVINATENMNFPAQRYYLECVGRRLGYWGENVEQLTDDSSEIDKIDIFMHSSQFENDESEID